MTDDCLLYIYIFGSSCYSLSTGVEDSMVRTKNLREGDGTISVRADADLESATAVHLVECLLEVVQLEFVSYHPLRLDFTAVKVRNGARETVRLRERADNLPIQSSTPDERLKTENTL